MPNSKYGYTRITVSSVAIPSPTNDHVGMETGFLKSNTTVASQNIITPERSNIIWRFNS
jgi:hypothetical protein